MKPRPAHSLKPRCSVRLITMAVFFSILLGAAVLIVYSLIEKRINQRPCPDCGYAVSVDSINEQCPRCAALIDENTDH